MEYISSRNNLSGEKKSSQIVEHEFALLTYLESITKINIKKKKRPFEILPIIYVRSIQLHSNLDDQS